MDVDAVLQGLRQMCDNDLRAMEAVRGEPIPERVEELMGRVQRWLCSEVQRMVPSVGALPVMPSPDGVEAQRTEDLSEHETLLLSQALRHAQELRHAWSAFLAERFAKVRDLEALLALTKSAWTGSGSGPAASAGTSEQCPLVDAIWAENESFHLGAITEAMGVAEVFRIADELRADSAETLIDRAARLRREWQAAGERIPARLHQALVFSTYVSVASMRNRLLQQLAGLKAPEPPVVAAPPPAVPVRCCPQCRTPAKETARFCGRCGSPLDPRSPAPPRTA